jgi:hypothetical protein
MAYTEKEATWIVQQYQELMGLSTMHEALLSMQKDYFYNALFPPERQAYETILKYRKWSHVNTLEN